MHPLLGYACPCAPGYRKDLTMTMDDFRCVDIGWLTKDFQNVEKFMKHFQPSEDECSEDQHKCEKYSYCQNTVGSHECICEEGFVKNNFGKCVDKNECAEPQKNFWDHKCGGTFEVCRN